MNQKTKEQAMKDYEDARKRSFLSTPLKQAREGAPKTDNYPDGNSWSRKSWENSSQVWLDSAKEYGTEFEKEVAQKIKEAEDEINWID